jgi:hypothetical protein
MAEKTSNYEAKIVKSLPPERVAEYKALVPELRQEVLTLGSQTVTLEQYREIGTDLVTARMNLDSRQRYSASGANPHRVLNDGSHPLGGPVS